MRALSAKDAMVKDLKSKLAAYESALTTSHHDNVAPSAAALSSIGITVAAVPGIGSPGPPPLASSNLSAAELRARYVITCRLTNYQLPWC